MLKQHSPPIYCNTYFIDLMTSSTVVLHFTSLIKHVLNKAKGHTYKIYQTNLKNNYIVLHIQIEVSFTYKNTISGSLV